MGRMRRGCTGMSPSLEGSKRDGRISEPTRDQNPSKNRSGEDKGFFELLPQQSRLEHFFLRSLRFPFGEPWFPSVLSYKEACDKIG